MWVKLGTLRGKDGLDGLDGRDGQDAIGEPGKNGLDGISITDIQQRTKDSFTILLSDKTEKTFQLPKLKGKGIAGGAGQETYLRSGDGAPPTGLGGLGDHYIDKTNKLFYGPKTGAGWGAGVSLGGGGDRYLTTSTTSNTIVSSGSLTFTVDAGLSYIPMQEVLIVHDASNHMHGSVMSYSGTTLIVDVKHKTGSGTYSSWTINLDGTPVDALTGSGTVGELATFTSAQVLGSTPIKTINGESIIGSGDITISSGGIDTYSFTFYGGF